MSIGTPPASPTERHPVPPHDPGVPLHVFASLRKGFIGSIQASGRNIHQA
jgi:hypothetical protein